MPRRGAKMSFRSDVKKERDRPERRSLRIRFHGTSDDITLHRKSAREGRPHPTEYDAEKGWLIPWKRISLPRPPPATAREQRIMKFWTDERKKMRESPLFVRRVVDYGFGSRVKKTAATPDRAGGGFTMLDTYTSKYEKPSRERPNHTGKLWLKEFLPKELWDVVDPSLRGNKKQAATTAQNPNATTKSRFNISAFSDDEDEGSLKSDADDSEAEEDAEAGEQDADMEDDESDNDDYNGEKYFDGGEGDDDLGEGADVDAYGDEVGGGGGDEEREFTRDDEFDVA